MVGSSLASLLAHSWVSLDFDLASVSCQELNGKQQLDEKTVVEVLLLMCMHHDHPVTARKEGEETSRA